MCRLLALALVRLSLVLGGAATLAAGGLLKGQDFQSQAGQHVS